MFLRRNGWWLIPTPGCVVLIAPGKVAVGLVGSRTDSRTQMAQELNGFFKRSGLPVVMFVPDSFVYPQCARDGVSIIEFVIWMSVKRPSNLPFSPQ